MSESVSTHGENPGAREAACLLHGAAIHLLRRLRGVDTALAVSPARLSALSVLVFGGPRTLGELAAAEQVRPPTMTALVKSMQAEGWVRTSADKRDRRVTRITASSKGKRLLERGREARIAELLRLMNRLSPDDVVVLLRAAGIVERILAAER